MNKPVVRKTFGRTDFIKTFRKTASSMHVAIFDDLRAEVEH